MNEWSKTRQVTAQDILDDYEERAAVFEFDGGIDRAHAEKLAKEYVLHKYGVTV